MSHLVKPYLTVPELGVSGKTVLVRVDINAPIVDGKVAATDRIEAAAATLDQIAQAGGRVVVLAHQGRRGDGDFTSLREHAQILDQHTQARVHFVHDGLEADGADPDAMVDYVAGEKALAAIKALKDGDVLVLENVRAIADETTKGRTPAEHAKAPYVQALAGACNFYVNDAFSAAHRNQASMTGFPMLLPSAAGLTMDRELTALSRAVDEPEPPTVYFLGGSKPEDSIAVMRANFEKGTLDTALLGGLVGNLFMVARGHDLGRPSMDFLEKRGILALLPEAEELLEKYDIQIFTPQDIVVKNGQNEAETLSLEDLPKNYPALDIGEDTLAQYVEHIETAGSLMMNGPAGLYEEPPYDAGTRAILAAFAANDCFSLLGGGHTLAAMGAFGHSEEQFGYVSLAGGALMAYLTGKELPAVEALRENKASFATHV